MLFSRRYRKSTTPLVLAIWLFALVSSVAQACGFADDVEHAGVNVIAVLAAHQDAGEQTSPTCEKFCADDLALVTKLSAVEDSPAGTAVLAPAPDYAVPVVSATRTSWLLSGPDPPPGIAVNTRFVRLAL